MNMGLAPRPANEDLRAQTVVKTGLVDAPNPDLFQIYCELAKDITGFETASFSLYDGEMKCSIAEAGSDDFVPGTKSERSEWNVCSYVCSIVYLLLCIVYELQYCVERCCVCTPAHLECVHQRRHLPKCSQKV